MDLIKFRTNVLEAMEKVFSEMERIVEATYLRVGGVEEGEKNEKNFEMRVKSLLTKSRIIISIILSSLLSSERREEVLLLSRILYEHFLSFLFNSSSLLLSSTKQVIIRLPEQSRTIIVGVPSWFTKENIVEVGKRVKEEVSREALKRRVEELRGVEVKKNSLKLYNNVLEKLVNTSHSLQKMVEDLKKEVDSRKGKKEIEMIEPHHHSD